MNEALVFLQSYPGGAGLGLSALVVVVLTIWSAIRNAPLSPAEQVIRDIRITTTPLSAPECAFVDEFVGQQWTDEQIARLGAPVAQQPMVDLEDMSEEEAKRFISDDMVKEAGRAGAENHPVFYYAAQFDDRPIRVRERDNRIDFGPLSLDLDRISEAPNFAHEGLGDFEDATECAEIRLEWMRENQMEMG